MCLHGHVLVNYLPDEIMKNASLTEQLLISNPQTRDDNPLLVVMQWAREMKIKGNEPITLLQIYKAMKEGKLTQPDTITRASRKLQEENVDLQGKEWQGRQQKAFKFKEEIKKTDWRR